MPTLRKCEFEIFFFKEPTAYLEFAPFCKSVWKAQLWKLIQSIFVIPTKIYIIYIFFRSYRTWNTVNTSLLYISTYLHTIPLTADAFFCNCTVTYCKKRIFGLLLSQYNPIILFLDMYFSIRYWCRHCIPHNILLRHTSKNSRSQKALRVMILHNTHNIRDTYMVFLGIPLHIHTQCSICKLNNMCNTEVCCCTQNIFSRGCSHICDMFYSEPPSVTCL